MIRSHLRAGVALACALGLSACGGGDGDVYLSGVARGVTKPGLVLTNNGGSDLPVNESGRFTFKDLVETDTRYSIAVKSLPPNVEGTPESNCVVYKGTGRAVFPVTNIEVVCTIRKRPLGGSVRDLKVDGLVLVNGTDQVAVPANATEFAMSRVSEESPYGVTVLKQPNTGSCTVENGSGTMTPAGVADIVVRCTP